MKDSEGTEADAIGWIGIGEDQDEYLEQEAWRLGHLAADPDALDDPRNRGFLRGLIRIDSCINAKGHIIDAEGRRRTLYKTADQVRGENRGRRRAARRNETPEQAEERKRKNRERMRAKRAKENSQ